MSIINVDDHGPQHTTTPLTRFGDAAESSGVPTEYLAAIRDGTPGYRYSVPVARGLTATITLTAPASGQPPYDTRRETESWMQLRAVITSVNGGAATCVLHPDLPAEIATATWTRDGTRVRVTRPGTPRPAALARWRALSAAPLTAVLGQKLTQATVTGATAAALLVPLPPLTAPPRHAAPIQADDLRTGRDHYQPPVPAILTRAPAPAVAPPLLPGPDDDTERDTAPDLSPAPAPPTEPAVTLPPEPEPTPGPSGTPPPADGEDGGEDGGDEPHDNPDPSPEPTTPAPPPTTTAPTPTSNTTPRPTRKHRPGRHHGHRHKHGHHRPRRGR